jgi:hypothetical protein
MCWRADGKYMSEFATYQQFFSAEEADGVIAILNEHGIPYTFKQSSPRFDSVIIGENLNEQWDLRIPTDQFSHVNDLLLANTTVNIDDLEKDHYLFSFSPEELKNIIKNPDEWGRHDYLVAVELLKQHGENVTKEQLQDLREKKIETLSKPPKKVPGFWLVVAYLLPVWAAIRVWTPAIFGPNDLEGIFVWTIYFANYLMTIGGVIATFIGLSLWRFSKPLPNGSRVYRFLAADRKHGKIIFFLGMIAILSIGSAFLYLSGTGIAPYEIFY